MKKAITIKADPRNYRLHPDANKRIIRKSLEDLGAGRSIVIDKEDCAHGCHEKASIALRRQNDLIVVVPSVSSCLLY